jgi:hypoxanthine phosphoribosyltransferase
MAGNKSLSLNEIKQRLELFKFPDVDLVIGIASGGVFPAKLVADILKTSIRFISINFRSSDNKPLYTNPKIIMKDSIPIGHKRLLLVDDVSVSGKTLRSAKDNFNNYDVYTFVLKGKADFVLFPEISECVDWPWKLKS